MRIKICGITQPDQGQAIAHLGATALGFICVPSSPRYVTHSQIQAIVKELPSDVDKIGVFVNAPLSIILETVTKTGLTGVQLHGNESPQFCEHLRQCFPEIELIKALRIRASESLAQAETYTLTVNTLLLDAYHPQQWGGTGQTLAWETLTTFNPKRPWLLAGGLTPDNIQDALKQVKPHGIDLSSGVEKAPGDKDLDKVAQLFEQLQKTTLLNCFR